MKLFWIDSLDHGEDWFVVGLDSVVARTFYANALGYDEIEDEITALEVCEVPGLSNNEPPFFADDTIIKQCGGELEHYDNADLLNEVDKNALQAIDGETRVVNFGNRIFVEGNVLRSALYYLRKHA